MEKIHKESDRHKDMDKSVDKDFALTIGIFSDRFALRAFRTVRRGPTSSIYKENHDKPRNNTCRTTGYCYINQIESISVNDMSRRISKISQGSSD